MDEQKPYTDVIRLDLFPRNPRVGCRSAADEAAHQKALDRMAQRIDDMVFAELSKKDFKL